MGISVAAMKIRSSYGFAIASEAKNSRLKWLTNNHFSNFTKVHSKTLFTYVFVQLISANRHSSLAKWNKYGTTNENFVHEIVHP
jgi:hypothetical protein